MAKRVPHPPKDKKTNKPRQASPIPLSPGSREQKARLEFSKSIMLLNEAKRLAAWGEAPNACIHSAYYAMYHCANAVVLASGGVGKKLDAPESHAHILMHFGKILEKQQPDMGRLGLMLNRARTDRVISDYGLHQGPDSKLASATVKDAIEFVEKCEAIWSLKRETSFMDHVELLAENLANET